MVFALFCVLIIYFTYTDYVIKLDNFKEKQRRELCNYLSNNIIFYDKASLKKFLINQYYELIIFSGKKALNEETVNSIYTDVTKNNTKIIQFYNDSCIKDQ
jgi:hypothetical protein